MGFRVLVEAPGGDGGCPSHRQDVAWRWPCRVQVGHHHLWVLGLGSRGLEGRGPASAYSGAALWVGWGQWAPGYSVPPEQMGRILQRTAISTNIKERLDFSCALFGPDGGLVSNAPHIPVHLGAMQETVQFQVRWVPSASLPPPLTSTASNSRLSPGFRSSTWVLTSTPATCC